LKYRVRKQPARNPVKNTQKNKKPFQETTEKNKDLEKPHTPLVHKTTHPIQPDRKKKKKKKQQEKEHNKKSNTSG